MAVKESQRTAFHEALRLLLTRRFILRETDPEDYFLIRRLERPLKEYFEGRCGWTFYIHAKFFKLEKIPEQPRAYSGIESMQGPEDYALLCTVFAFLEEQDVGGQFLLSQMLEVLPGLYPETAPLPLSWESYTMRRALIRVMRALEQEQVIQVVEDESADFLKKDFSAGNPQGEALYEVTVLARYFLRHFPKGIRQYETAADFAAADFEPEGLGMADRILQRCPSAHAWHYEAEEYRPEGGAALSESRLAKLGGIQSAQLLPAAKRLRDRKQAYYQESFVQNLLHDMIQLAE